jgi:hypothetical protein
LYSRLSSIAYYLNNTYKFNIPACALNLPQLTTFHFAGNGISGTLPTGLYINSTLKDLSLSFNILHGSMPINFQKKKNWERLDLSFNQLNGDLKPFFMKNEISNNNNKNKNVILSLQVNRLSGKIPSSIKNLENLKILKSNLFSCKFDASDLPINDPARNSYECASNPFEVANIFGSAALVLIFLSLIVLKCFFKYHKMRLFKRFSFIYYFFLYTTNI